MDYKMFALIAAVCPAAFSTEASVLARILLFWKEALYGKAAKSGRFWEAISVILEKGNSGA